MKHTTTEYHQKPSTNILSFGPIIAELQQNPVPEDLHLFTHSLPYRMINDALFHIVMDANPDILKSLICALLNLDPKNISSIDLINPFELGNTVYDKNYVLDLKITLNDKILINIEVQILNLKFWKERSLGYLCRSFDNLNKGDDYSETKPAIQIGILDFEILDGDTEEDIACKRVLWAKFFKATTWEEISMLAKQEPIFAEAAKNIYRVTADDRVRYHCDAIECGERTYRTLVNQLNEQMQQLQIKDNIIAELKAQLAAKNETV